MRKREAFRPRRGETVYTVKQGDTLLKILVHEMGMGKKRARGLIPEIRRRNRLEGPGELEAGTEIIIPLHGKRRKPYKQIAHHSGKKRRAHSGSEIVTHRLSLFKGAQESSRDVIRGARLVWDKLLPAKQNPETSYSINGRSFSLDLDPVKFPVFSTVTGDRIIVDTGGNLSPLVKSLIEQNDPRARLVSYAPGDRRGFFSELLNAAGFYSVEKNFTVSFGTDPKLTVNADFKVENDPDSPLQNDIFLINTARGKEGFPGVLVEFMALQGFRVIEVSPAIREGKGRSGNAICVITEKEPYAMTERLLSALSLGYEKNRVIDLYNMSDGGIGLRIKADRYFERKGRKYVVSVFKGDAEEYTLLRLLDSLNYHVIILDPKEDFRSITSKILSKVDLPGSYAMHDLLPDRDLPYGIQMSGIMIDALKNPGKLFLTETRPDPVVTELLEINGYMIMDAGR